MAHLKRKDSLLTSIALVSSVMYWFNPLVWLALRKLYLERERACDDCVVHAGNKASAYAGYLLEIAKGATLKGRFSPLLASIVQRSKLEDRLMALLDAEQKRNTLSVTRGIAAVAICVSFLVPFSGIQTWAQIAAVQQDTGEVRQETDEVQSIRNTLAEFYTALEELDFNRVVKYFAAIKDYALDRDKKVPVMLSQTVERKDGERDTWVALMLGPEWSGMDVTSEITKIGKVGDNYLVSEDVTIVGIRDGKRILLVENPEHEITFKKVDGEWKIEGTHKFNIVDKESGGEEQKGIMGLYVNKDGIKCLLLTNLSSEQLKLLEDLDVKAKIFSTENSK